jgi:DNA replication protein DnaC
MNEFDFDFQPSINKKEILDLKSLGFLEKKENLIFIGSPGVGKTHLVIALGIEACHQGHRTLFISCHELLLRLRTAYEKGTIERVIKRYVRYDVLIIDEIGYLPIQKVEADLFFQLLSLRYEQKTTMVTSNITLSRWGELFQNTEIAAAILDRLVHHAKIFKITGKSYRLKGKLKSD